MPADLFYVFSFVSHFGRAFSFPLFLSHTRIHTRFFHIVSQHDSFVDAFQLIGTFV